MRGENGLVRGEEGGLGVPTRINSEDNMESLRRSGIAVIWEHRLKDLEGRA